MALKGTLKDFGIADIFQLISHQSKTGVLHLQSKDKEVRISFLNGDVVRAESTTRKSKDLIGSMLVRAEVITEAQLEQALTIQKRTLKRLGDLLVEHGFISRGEMREFTRLQTTETLYRLFNWESGTYAFEAEAVVYDEEAGEPIRSENILMEGFRMLDEWPIVRKRISSYEMTFTKVKEIDDSIKSAEGDEVDAAFDDMFSEKKPAEKKSKNMGSNEKKVFEYVREDRNVQKLIDLSRLGEFETCKALMNLLNEGYIKVVSKKDSSKTIDKPGGSKRSFSFTRIVVQGGMYVVLLAIFYLLFEVLNLNPMELFEPKSTTDFQNPVVREAFDSIESRRIDAALDVYRLETGVYPEDWDELLSTGLLTENDIRFPWKAKRLYKRKANAYVMLRPFK